MKASLVPALIVGAFLGGAPLCAQSVIFSFNETLNNAATYSDTQSGITISLSNPNSNNGRFAADSDGNLLTSDSSQGPTSFQMSFSQAVQITDYSIGFVIDGTTGSFSLARTGLSSTGNDLSQAGSFPISGIFTAAANQVITLTSDPTGSPGWSQIKSFTVTPVPEPAETMAVVAAACGVAGLLIRRRSR